MSGLMRSAGVLLLILATAAGAQTAQDQLKKARTLAATNKFAPALKLVDKAMVEPGNDLETTIELLELSGVCNAGLKKAAPAKLAFQKLLSLAPSYVLNRKGPAVVMAAFADAKATAQPMNIQPTAPDMSAGKINDVAVEVSADPFKLAKTVLFNYRAVGGKWHTRAVPVTMGRVAAKVDGTDKVEWYATVLGPNDAEILRIRNVDAPITHTYRAPAPRAAPEPVKAAEPAKAADAPRRADPTPSTAQPSAALTPDPVKEPPLEVVERGPHPKGWVSPLAWTTVGAGVVAGGVGTYFGIQSRNVRSRFATSTATDPVVGLTRARALELDSQVQSNAAIANTLWVTAGVLVATGVLIRLLGPTEVTQ
jgi:hypothetical protein